MISYNEIQGSITAVTVTDVSLWENPNTGTSFQLLS